MKHYLSSLGAIEDAVCSAERILIACDFDGTLCPIESSPAAVQLPETAAECLRRLTESEGVTLAIISGRSLEDLSQRVPLDLICAGNHGLEIRCDGVIFKQAGAVHLEPQMRVACEALGDVVSGWPGAWVENKGLSATVHYRNLESPLTPSLLYSVRRKLAQLGGPFSYRAGKKAFELRPKVAWDKGSALRYIQERSGPFDLCICIGDDRTDESMFRANCGQLNIRVGCGRPSAATLYVSDPGETAILLDHVAASRGMAIGAGSRAAGHF